MNRSHHFQSAARFPGSAPAPLQVGQASLTRKWVTHTVALQAQIFSVLRLLSRVLREMPSRGQHIPVGWPQASSRGRAKTLPAMAEDNALKETLSSCHHGAVGQLIMLSRTSKRAITIPIAMPGPWEVNRTKETTDAKAAGGKVSSTSRDKACDSANTHGCNIPSRTRHISLACVGEQRRRVGGWTQASTSRNVELIRAT